MLKWHNTDEDYDDYFDDEDKQYSGLLTEDD